MSALWTSLVGLMQSLISPIASGLKSLLTFNAGKTAADDSARQKESADDAKANAAREAARSRYERDADSRKADDGFERH